METDEQAWKREYAINPVFTFNWNLQTVQNTIDNLLMNPEEPKEKDDFDLPKGEIFDAGKANTCESCQ